MLEQVSDPFSILNVCFPPWNRLDMLGIAQEKLHLPFEHIPDALPIHAGTLHCYGLAALSFEPIAEPEEIRDHRAKCLGLLLHSLCSDDEETGHDHFLVNINSATAMIHDSHCSSPFRMNMLIEEACQVGYQRTKRVLCVLLLEESDIWWCLKVSPSVFCSGLAHYFGIRLVTRHAACSISSLPR